MLHTQRPQPATCDTAPGLIALEQAVALALEQVKPIDRLDRVVPEAAVGRVAAERVLAPAAMPFFDNSAMDGLALCHADLAATDTLPISGTAPAGAAPGTLAPGTALRIFTGAPLPGGADTVVMSEHCTDLGGAVRVDHPPKPGANIRRAGSDQAEGACLLRPGHPVAARHIGLLAANGIGEIAVARRPRVAVFSTGDELAEGRRGPGAIFDANRPMLLALCRAAGADATDLGGPPDDLDATMQALGDLRDDDDLILTSGAVSVGGRDHVRAALDAAGGQLAGWRVAVKPGKPVAIERLANAGFTGLPGNPFAAFVGFALFVRPQIARLAGGEAPAFAATPARAGFHWSRKPGRAEVFPVRLAGYDEHGAPIVARLGDGVSATLFPLADADGLRIVSAATAEIAPGDILHWQPFNSWGGLE